MAASPDTFNAGKAARLAANVPSVSISMTVLKPLGLIASAAACTSLSAMKFPPQREKGEICFSLYWYYQNPQILASLAVVDALLLSAANGNRLQA